MGGTNSNFNLTSKWIVGILFALFLLISCAEIFDLPDITQAPRIISIEPAEGPEGTLVTITGLHFSPVEGLNQVKFNSKPGIIMESSITGIKAIVPEDAGSGPVEVVVGDKATEGPNFNFLYIPVIYGVQPLEGRPGTQVILTGNYFDEKADANLVQFGGKTATVLKSDSTIQLTVILPADAQSGPVTVSVKGLIGTGPLFSVLPMEQPVHSISGIEPTSGKAGTVVTITGESFSSVPENNLVKFKDAPADILFASPTKLEVQAPEVGISGIVSVTIGALIANGPEFTYILDPPLISQYVPDFGYPGDTIEIIGENFSLAANENLVKFNGKEAEVLGSTGLILKVIVPEDAGTGAVTISVEDQTATGPEFTFLDNAPVITDFNPKTGPVGTVVVIQGKNFGSDVNALTVRFHGVESAVSKVENGTSVTVEVPQGATTASITVEINQKTATSSRVFTVTVADPPLLITYPSQLRVRENLTIRGTNFSAEASENVLKIGNFDLEVTYARTDQLEVYVPDGASSGILSLTVNGVKAFFSGRGETTELEVQVNQWARTGDLLEARDGHTATILNDGRVLVAGGRNTNEFLNSVEIYDPGTNTWTHSGYLHLERAQHTANILSDGKILFIGGYSPIGVLNQCEIYDPVTGTSNLIESLQTPRAQHSSIVLNNGQVLVISGSDDGIHEDGFPRTPALLSTCEVFNPNENLWTFAAPLQGRLVPIRPLYSRERYTSAIKLLNGNVFFVGWVNDDGISRPSCQVFDPQSNSWSPTNSFPLEPHFRPLGLALLQNGDVFLSRIAMHGQYDLYKTASNSWTKVGNNALFVTNEYSTSILDDGRILMAGGGSSFESDTPWPRHFSSLLDPESGQVNSEIGNVIDRQWHTATKLNNGTVLITGGLGSSRISIPSSEIFVPAKQ